MSRGGKFSAFAIAESTASLGSIPYKVLTARFGKRLVEGG